MTRALITGITGFVGSHLADYLLANTDWEVFGTHRWRSPLDNIEHLVPLVNEGRIKLIEMELRDADSVSNAVRAAEPNYVFHLAAQSYPKASFNSACDTYEVNVCGTERLLSSLRGSGATIHVCSSSEVYGRTPKELTPIREDCPFHPASPYAISKVGTDLVARHYAEAHKMRIVVTRMFTHTGPRRGDVFAESSFAKQIAMIEAGQLHNVVKVGNLQSVRTVADVRDAVRAYHLAVTSQFTDGAVYNIGGTFTTTVGGILRQLLSFSDKSVMVEVDQERLRPIDADNQVPNSSAFRNLTGWEPRYAFIDTMTDLLNYWRERVKTRNCLQR